MQTKIEKISALSALAVNNIQEVASQDVGFLSFRERLALSNISREEKKNEWKAARIALKSALDQIDLPYPGFYKDEHGKSHPKDGHGYVSLTHTRGIAAAIFHKNMPVGIDLDYVRDKVVNLGPKFLDSSEMEFLQSDPLRYTMAWSAKESIFKCQGKKGISLRENILLEPFSESDSIIKGKIYHSDFSDHHYQVKIEVSGDMVLSYTVW
ncbi:4'-phosphopantetheinyl transferase superfamily protein [Belliella sp. DSM 111904]|uniref:4'-phosphopantetheinyl transferase superfamily protein n=1 Tax=Belliella filtrata TaxID=2923435 RepID=A0ABS9V182_9BACT|nr:4'-phosphopantetheinyl transferase superfamily protein [Belliella filtrata]MCH7410104.1 4'-phosphopantetheinyl transferase superfamily protein [Belliella filtrata]